MENVEEPVISLVGDPYPNHAFPILALTE